MRILVIDDSRINLAAAQAQLGTEHKVAVVSSSAAALQLMGNPYDYSKKKTHHHDFDVVLCDLLLPSPARACRIQVEMDTGVYLAITAARNGARMVGLLTDINHYQHPASDCLDSVQRNEIWPDVFLIDGALVCMCNTRKWVDTFLVDNLARPLTYDERQDTPEVKTVRAKNWRALLERLLKAQEEMPTDPHSVGKLVAEHKALKQELVMKQAESADLAAEVKKLEDKLAQSRREFATIHTSFNALVLASKLSWWKRLIELPRAVKDVVDSITN